MTVLDKLEAMLAEWQAEPRSIFPSESYYKLAYEAVNALPALIAVARAAERFCASPPGHGRDWDEGELRAAVAALGEEKA